MAPEEIVIIKVCYICELCSSSAYNLSSKPVHLNGYSCFLQTIIKLKGMHRTIYQLRIEEQLKWTQ